MIERSEALAALDRATQECPHPLLCPRPRLIDGQAAAQLLLGQFRQHDLHGFRPSGQELPGIEAGRGLFPEHTFFDHHHIEAAPDCCFRRAQAGKAPAGDQEVAGQAFIGGGRG